MVSRMELTEVKQNMNREILYKPIGVAKGTPYILTGCILRRRKGEKFFYQAEITDIPTKNSIVICSLDDIQKVPALEGRINHV